MFGLSLMHWFIVVLVVIVLFGRNTISNLMKDIGGGIREAKKAAKEIGDGT